MARERLGRTSGGAARMPTIAYRFRKRCAASCAERHRLWHVLNSGVRRRRLGLTGRCFGRRQRAARPTKGRSLAQGFQIGDCRDPARCRSTATCLRQINSRVAKLSIGEVPEYPTITAKSEYFQYIKLQPSRFLTFAAHGKSLLFKG